MNDRHGNPSDPDEEAERVRKALANVQNWQDKYGGAGFSGGVRMQYQGDGGASRVYGVPIGRPEITEKAVCTTFPPQPQFDQSFPQTASTAAPPWLVGKPDVVRQFAWQRAEHLVIAEKKEILEPRHWSLRWLFNWISTEKTK